MTPLPPLRRDFLKTNLLLASSLSLRGLTPLGFAQVSAAPTAAAPRPRLFFPPERIAAFRARLERDATLQTRWSDLLRRAEELLTAPLMTQAQADAAAGSNALYPAASRQMMERGFTFGLAWQITREDRYAAKLREALLHFAAFERWQGPEFFKRVPSWNSSLWTAAFTVGSAAGCDALDGYLEPQDRALVTSSIVRRGIEPLLGDWVLPPKRIHSLDSMGHNWWAVCVAGAGVGALAVFADDPRASGWVRECEAALVGFLDYPGDVLFNKPANFDPTGAFYESTGYASYSFVEYLIFRLAQQNALPHQPPVKIPVLDRAAEFFAHSSYPSAGGDLAVNFGDSSLRRQWTHVMRLFAMQGFSPELTRWYLARAASASRTEREREDPLSLLYLDERDATPRNTLPLAILYPTIGWAILRSSWENDATMLAVKSGDTWNHAHADAGSFILFHGGRQLLIDSGTCSYGRREYVGYYTQSRAHNVVLFNGHGQPREDFERGAKFPGSLHHLIDGLGLKYLYADATGPMARYFTRNYRHWLWLDGVILIFDDLLAHEAGRFDWLLHYEGEVTRQDRQIDVVNGPSRARVTMLFPEVVQVREEEGLVEQQPDQKAPYFVLSNSEPTREQKFIVAIVPQTANSPTPPQQLELLRDPLALGVRVRAGEQITDVYFNLQADGRRMHHNSNNTIAGWDTDAYLFAVTFPATSNGAAPENISRYFVSTCSYLRHGQRVVFDTLAKVDAVFHLGSVVQIHLAGAVTTGLALSVPETPGDVIVNKNPVAFEYSEQDRLLRLGAREIRGESGSTRPGGKLPL